MNIYYYPEKFGVEIVDTYETGWSYSFDKTILFRKNGDYFVLHDSGCSCPTPFENLGVNDLISISSRDELRRFVEDNHYEVNYNKLHDFVNRLPPHLK